MEIAGGPKVAVIAPVPTLTITVEPGDEIHLHAGGQGCWVARMAARLGADVVLCSAFGGETGEVLRSLIRGEGLAVADIASAGSNGAYIHDRRSGMRTELVRMPATVLGRHAADDLYGAALARGVAAAVTVLTGTDPEGLVPPTFYRRLTTDLRANRCITVADLTGAALDAAVLGGCDVIKVSAEDLAAESRTDAEPAGLAEWMRKTHRAGVASVLVTRGPLPALALADGELLEAAAPRVSVRDPSGAGDSFTAAVATALAHGRSLREALALGVAAGALNVTRSGLGTGRAPDIRTMAENVTISPLHL